MSAMTHVVHSTVNRLMRYMFCCQVIKNPVESHLPTGCVKIATSFHADLVDVRELVSTSQPIVLVVGAMSHGSVSSLLLLCTLS